MAVEPRNPSILETAPHDVPSVRRRLKKARNRYRSAKRAGATAYATAEALLAYTYVLEFHADQGADVGPDARDVLGACIRQLDAAVLWQAPAPVIEEYVACLDEQAMFIEVALQVPASRDDDVGGVEPGRRPVLVPLPTAPALSRSA
jgi:hypothetical protein